jgi:hypothetical protein
MRDYLLVIVTATLCALLLQLTAAHAVPPPPGAHGPVPHGAPPRP